MVSNAGMLMGQCLGRIRYDGVVTLLRQLFQSWPFLLICSIAVWRQQQTVRCDTLLVIYAPNAFLTILQRLSRSFSFFSFSTIWPIRRRSSHIR